MIRSLVISKKLHLLIAFGLGAKKEKVNMQRSKLN